MAKSVVEEGRGIKFDWLGCLEERIDCTVCLLSLRPALTMYVWLLVFVVLVLVLSASKILLLLYTACCGLSLAWVQRWVPATPTTPLHHNKKKLSGGNMLEKNVSVHENTSIPCISEEQRESCEGYLRKSKYLMSWNKMKNGAAPFSDGITAEFFKVFWSHLGKLITASLYIVICLNLVLKLLLIKVKIYHKINWKAGAQYLTTTNDKQWLQTIGGMSCITISSHLW